MQYLCEPLEKPFVPLEPPKTVQTAFGVLPPQKKRVNVVSDWHMEAPPV